MWTYQFAEELHTSDWLGFERFATMRNHYNLVYREKEHEMLPFCQREGIGVVPCSPLARDSSRTRTTTNLLATTRRPAGAPTGRQRTISRSTNGSKNSPTRRASRQHRARSPGISTTSGSTPYHRCRNYRTLRVSSPGVLRFRRKTSNVNPFRDRSPSRFRLERRAPDRSSIVDGGSMGKQLIGGL